MEEFERKLHDHDGISMKVEVLLIKKSSSLASGLAYSIDLVYSGLWTKSKASWCDIITSELASALR